MSTNDRKNEPSEFGGGRGQPYENSGSGTYMRYRQQIKEDDARRAAIERRRAEARRRAR